MNSNKHPIALQLYSLRDLAQQDFVRTLELTAELGYEGVEFAGYGGLSRSEMKDHLMPEPQGGQHPCIPGAAPGPSG